MFFPDDPTLAFVGFARPFVGSVPAVAEAQSRVIAKVFSGAVPLPTRTEMKRIIKNDKRVQKRTFPQDSERLPFLVHPALYGDDILRPLSASPKLGSLFFTNPALFWKVLIGPMSPFHYRMHDPDPKKRRIAINEIEKYYYSPIGNKVLGRVKRVFFEILFFVIIVIVLLYLAIQTFGA